MPDSNKQKIFVTVGTDLPFDRLVKAVDHWAEQHPQYDVLAQIGDSLFVPSNMLFQKFVEPDEYKRIFSQSALIVSHAGMGTILTSLQFQKPLLVVPRKASLGEHRNEHQLATAKHLKSLNKVEVAEDEHELIKKLSTFSELKIKDPIGPFACKRLTDSISKFIRER
ncbi:glycosyltransferase [Pelagicoccus sp. SDUM812002]|uniref:glycosyltransferase n=1 Tax=Pelagicoccus sp. SDUM812002 TaxID=3041266 RepID=UPI00280D09F4|nr:glycosyltransferase [Pelagicoccus sp. SDUM812002]MDQ8188064.1 glycosyltransferase [Pelagicoccus sp. SDUM812002]